MSWIEANEPVCRRGDSTPAVELTMEARARKIDGFSVGRVLPSGARRLAGPFIFFDHIGPAELEPGHGMAVRPPPHMNLATGTYLFDGHGLHRELLVSARP